MKTGYVTLFPTVLHYLRSTYVCELYGGSSSLAGFFGFSFEDDLNPSPKALGDVSLTQLSGDRPGIPIGDHHVVYGYDRCHE